MKIALSTVIICLILVTGCDKEDASLQARDLAVAYVNDLGENFLKKGYAFQHYWHPDYVLLGGEVMNCAVIDEGIEVVNVDMKIMDLNYQNPGEEEIISVELKMTLLGTIWGEEFEQKKQEYLKTLHFSTSTGKPLIIDSTDNERMISFLKPAKEWLVQQGAARE